MLPVIRNLFDRVGTAGEELFLRLLQGETFRLERLTHVALA